MKFEKHLFISYAHLDNLPTPEDKRGWVTRFQDYLVTYLSENMGEEARIWRDDKLRGDDIFAAEIIKQFPQTALLLSVLSPRYLKSEWCLKEVSEFCRTAENNGGVTIDDKARVLHAMRRGIPSESRKLLPEIFQKATGYKFFEAVDGNRELALDPLLGNGETYRRQIYFLADDIAKLLEKISQTEVQAEISPPPAPPCVYLAECGYELQEIRDKMRGELRGLGYRVLPEPLANLPDTEPAYIAEVKSMLTACGLSIHMVGATGGKVLDGPSRKAVLEIQNEVAAEMSETHALPRIIWIPEGISSLHSDQQTFRNELQTEASLQSGADLVMSDFEALKRVVYDALLRLKEPQAAKPDNELLPAGSVHIIFDQKDRRASVPFRRFLIDQGYDVKIPLFEGDAATVRRANEDMLAESDVIVVFYGEGGEQWKRTVDNDLSRMKGYRKRPLLATYTYLSDPLTNDKSDLIDFGAQTLIDGVSGFSEAACGALVETLRFAKNGAAPKE